MTLLLPLMMNNLLSEGGEPEAEVEAAVVSSAGSGSKPWWEGEWIIPGVTHYLPKKPPDDITPLRPKVEQARKRLAKIDKTATAKEYRALSQRISRLAQASSRLEERAERVVKQQAKEKAVDGVVNRYRQLAEQYAAVDLQLAIFEAEAERRRRIMAEDKEVMKIIFMAMDDKGDYEETPWRLPKIP